MDKPFEPGDDPGPDPHGIDTAALMSVARNLPRFAMPENEPIPDDPTGKERSSDVVALSLYIEMHNALCQFIETCHVRDRRPTVGTTRDSLDRLTRALAELQAAWIWADDRSKVLLSEMMGKRPFEGVEARPLTEATAPADRWARGAYRIAKFREAATQLAGKAMVARRFFARAEQDTRGLDYPGIDALVDRLADIFERHKKRFSTSRNHDNATEFVEEVVATLPEDCRPGSVGRAVWRVSSARKRAADSGCR